MPGYHTRSGGPMENDMSKEELQQDDESLDNEARDAEFDNAWDEDDAHDDAEGDTDAEDEDTSVDENGDQNTGDDFGSDDDANGDADKPDSTDTEKAGEDDKPTDPKEVQQEKSWAGRLAKREEELAKKETAFKQKQEENRKKIRELMSADDDDTDWDALAKAAEELEMPEFALLTKKVQKLEQAQRTQLESAEAQSQFEAESHKERSEAQAYRDHVSTIAAKYPDFQEIVNMPEFNSFLNTLDPIARTGADMVLQKGNAAQVITLLDSFETAQNKPKPNAQNPADALAGTRRGASRQRSEVDMNDFDAGWDEAD